MKLGLWVALENMNTQTDTHTQDLSFISIDDYIRHLKEKKKKTSTTTSCNGPIRAKKAEANSVPGPVFSHLMPKMDLYYFHRFSWEKRR